MTVDHAESQRNSPMTVEATTDNLVLNHHFMDALRDTTKALPRLKVLDFGAGANPYNITIFSHIRDEQETVAYEPALNQDILKGNPRSPVVWKKDPPKGQEFDLAVCSFSLHHMKRPPEEALHELQDFHPKYIAVADYDFTDATLEDFKKEFLTETEGRELASAFGGDWQKCFDFHRKYGKSEYINALENNGFKVLPDKIEEGKGAAKGKFFVIAQAA